MSLRDWFAGQALGLTTFSCDAESEDGTICNARLHAEAAYRIADAMLAEHAKA